MNKLEYIPGDIVKIEYGKATGKIGFVTITFLRRKGCYSLVVFIGKGFQGSSKDDWIQTYNDEVSPIPLTTEILEKNGWERKVMSRGIKNSHLVYTKPDIEEYGYFPIYIEKVSVKSLMYICLHTTMYVHKLHTLSMFINFSTSSSV